MNSKLVITHIVNWLQSYSNVSNTNGFVIGISGGIDSAVTSTLCALTGKQVIALNMPIRQFKIELDRSTEHIAWLKAKFTNVQSQTVDLTASLEVLEKTLPPNITNDFLSMAIYGVPQSASWRRALDPDYTYCVHLINNF